MTSFIASDHGVYVGDVAARSLIDRFPKAYVFFGEHAGPEEFYAAITRPGWLVFERRGHWVVTKDLLDGYREVHWFFPYGVDARVARTIIEAIFHLTDAEMLVGETPEGHWNSLPARLVSRSLGAEREQDHYILSRDKFMSKVAQRASTG